MDNEGICARADFVPSPLAFLVHSGAAGGIGESVAPRRMLAYLLTHPFCFLTVGQPLSLLLKQSTLITDLALYDV